MLGLQNASQTGKAVLECCSTLTTVQQNKFGHRLQPLFPNVQKTTLTPHQCYPWVNPKINNHTQFHQVHPKIEDHIRKADLSQQKEAQCHKCNYDKHSKAVSLRMGDTVLVHVTAFKGRHKI